MIQPGTARLSCPHQYLKKESRGKGQEHHHFPPTLYWGWHREPHLLLPKKNGHPLQTKPLLSAPPSYTGCGPAKGASCPTVSPHHVTAGQWSRGRGPAAGDGALATAQLSQVWRDPKQGTTHSTAGTCNPLIIHPQSPRPGKGCKGHQPHKRKGPVQAS